MNKNILLITLVLGLCLATATSVELRRSHRLGRQAQNQNQTQPATTSISSSNSSQATPQVQSSVPSSASAPSTQAAAPAPPQPTIDDIIAQLTLAKNNKDRMNILNQDSDFVFDFQNPVNGSEDSGKGGSIITASKDTFPAAFGNGLSMSVGYIAPCGLNTPHIHPRASEMNFAVNGTFTTGFIAENGARTVVNTVDPGQMTIFPKGSIHWQANIGCQPVMFVAAFNDEDPGVSQIAQNFFDIPQNIVTAALGGASTNSVSSISSSIPDDVAQTLMSCMQNCGFIRPQYNYPPGYNGGYPQGGYPQGGYNGYPTQGSYTGYPSGQGNNGGYSNGQGVYSQNH